MAANTRAAEAWAALALTWLQKRAAGLQSYSCASRCRGGSTCPRHRLTRRAVRFATASTRMSPPTVAGRSLSTSTQRSCSRASSPSAAHSFARRRRRCARLTCCTKRRITCIARANAAAPPVTTSTRPPQPTALRTSTRTRPRRARWQAQPLAPPAVLPNPIRRACSASSVEAAERRLPARAAPPRLAAERAAVEAGRLARQVQCAPVYPWRARHARRRWPLQRLSGTV
mmetsp:Transcript_22145/g.56904  ORF Transcript_22145/g.56904 Transcript_22145/m.56904 type:complete len:229 (-) Transcript_22145:151-837(-)